MQESRQFRILQLAAQVFPSMSKQGEMAAYSFLIITFLIKSFFSDKEKQEMLSNIQRLSAIQYPEVDNILKEFEE